MTPDGHVTRTLFIPRNNPDLLLVSRGSNDNIDAETINITSARSQIRIFKVDEIVHGDAAVQYSSGGVLGYGLRNSVGIGEDPTTGNIVGFAASFFLLTVRVFHLILRASSS